MVGQEAHGWWGYAEDSVETWEMTVQMDNRDTMAEVAMTGWSDMGESPAGYFGITKIVSDSGTGTRDAIRKPEHPDPTAGKHVMHGRRVDGIRCACLASLLRPLRNAGEVRIEARRWRQPPRGSVLQVEKPLQESSRSRCVDHEPCGELQRVTGSVSVEANVVTLHGHVFERHLVEIDGAVLLGLFDEEVIDIRPIPVRIGDLVVRTRGHQQLTVVSGAVLKRPIELVMEEAEAALQAAADVWIRALPRAPLREWPQARQIVCVRQLLDEKVGQRRRRLANRETGMPSAFDQQDGSAGSWTVVTR